MRRASIQEECFRGIGIAAQFSFAGDPIAGENFRDRKTFVCIANGWSEESREFFSSETAVQFVPTVNRARNGYGMDAVCGHCGYAFGFQKFRRETRRRPTAGVQAIEFAGFG